MWRTNLKVLTVVIGTVTLYTLVANWIPQVESEVPEQLTFSGNVTADELVEAGESLYQGAGGCVACHGLGTRAPNLLSDEGGTGPIGARCDDRQPELDCKAYLHESMVRPGAYVVEGYEPIMPDMSRTLSPSQIWAVIAFLQSQGGEVTVEATDIGPAGTGEGDRTGAGSGTAGAATAGGAGESVAGGPATASTDPLTILRDLTCLACHQLDGEGGPIGPPLDDLGASRDAAYIRRAILEPAADTAPGYEAVAGTMPATFGDRMTAAQLEAVVRYLAGDGGGG